MSRLAILAVSACVSTAPGSTSMSAAPSSASRTVCNASGTWVLDHRMGEGTCNDARNIRSEWQVEHRGGDKINALQNPDMETIEMRVADVGGDCVLDVTSTANIVASGSPTMERYRYKLTERAGDVRGSGTYEYWGIDADVAAQPQCSQEFTVVGSVRR